MVINLDRAVRRIQMSPVGGDIELLSLTLDGPGEPVEIRFWSEEEDGRFFPPAMTGLIPSGCGGVVDVRGAIVEQVIEEICRHVKRNGSGSVRMDLTDSDIPGVGPIGEHLIVSREIESVDGSTIVRFEVAE